MKLKSILTVLPLLLLASCAPEPVRVSKVTLSSRALTLEVGTSETLTATISPFNADNSTIIWSSDNASVAKVSGGKVTAVAPGTAKIVASADDGGLSDACTVTVPIPFVFVSGVTLDQTSVELDEGSWIQLKATVTPANADDPSLRWTSSNQDVAQVTSDGTVLAMIPGTADITVTTVDGEKTAKCKVTVKNRVTALTLEPDKMDVLIGEESDIVAKLEPAGAKVNVIWKSASPNVVSVDEKGHIKALSAGDAVICASTDSKGLMAFCKIHVRNRVQSIAITASSSEVLIGETIQLKATVAPANLPDTEIQWTTSSAGIATVDANGLVTAKAKGKVTITATIINGTDSQSTTFEITVVQPVTSLSVSPSSLEIFVGDELEIGKDILIQVGPADADVATWHYGIIPSGSEVISIGKGVITGKEDGKVTLSVIADNSKPKDLTAKCTITVKAKVASITISGGGTRSMLVGDSVKLTANVKPSNANQEVTWSSSIPEVATIDANGNVKALKAGETTVSVASKENPEIKATCNIVVKNIPVESVTLNKSSLTLVEGNTETLTATVTPGDVIDKSVQWASSDPSVATVSDKGVVTAVKAGTASITATSTLTPDKKASCTVTVEPQFIHVTAISLDKTALTLEQGESASLVCTISPANASDDSVTWSSSDEKVAKVDASGLVTAVSAGTATIIVTANDNGKRDSCTVTVVPPPVLVSSITLSQTSATLAFGQTLALTATVLPEDATDPSVVWTSSNEKVATVSNGTVTAGSTAGTVTITAKSQSTPQVSAICTVEVKSKIVSVNGLSLDQVNMKLYVNQSKTLKATVTPSNADNKDVVWSVAQGGIIRVDQSGTVTGLRAGTSTVIAKTVDGGYMKTCSVTVTRNEVASVTLDKTSLMLKVGETDALEARVEGVDSSVKPSNSNVKWSSSSSDVTVDSKGRITAVKEGTATITVTSVDNSSKKATCEVRVLGSGTGAGGAEGIDFEDWNFQN